MTFLKLVPETVPSDKKLDVITVTSSVIIGRDSSAGLILPDSNVSRKHARLDVLPEGVFLEDLGSANGTYVNQQKIKRTGLKNGDLLSFGPFSLKVETDAVAPAPAAEEPPVSTPASR